MKYFWMSVLIWLAVMAYVLFAMPNETRELEQPEPNKLVAVDNGRIPGDDTVAVDPVIWEEDENDLIEAALIEKAERLDDVVVTFYCCEARPHICGTGNGITATGTKVHPNLTCAVDPKVIPLGSEVMVDFGEGDLVYLVAEDTGGAIRGNHIDIAVPLHSDALAMGVKNATVYFVRGEK